MSPQKKFVVTDDHLKLLRAMNWVWEDGYGYGAPAVDSKRPYGYSSGVDEDIADILGWEYDRENGLTESQARRAAAIHRETLEALELILATAQPSAGDPPRKENSTR